MIKGIKIKDEKKMLEELEEERKKRDFDKYGRDGYLVAGEENYIYKGVTYTLKLLRYFILKPMEFRKINERRIAEMHCVVEYPEKTKKLVEGVKAINDDYEFLYHDTLHSYNDNQTIEEQVDEGHRLAKQDIDRIPEIIKEGKEKVNKLMTEIPTNKTKVIK